MLISFSVKNYKSFGEKATISMVAASIREFREENVHFDRTNDLNILKSGVFFGHNSSGKSNLIQALLFVKSFVEHSAIERGAHAPIPVDPFLLNNTGKKSAVEFEIEFIHLGRHYKYRFAVDQSQVISENLTEILSRSRKELLDRKGDETEFARSIRKESAKRLEFVRKNALVLSTLAQTNSSWALEIVQWFGKLVVFDQFITEQEIQNTARMIQDGESKRMILAFLANAKLGFSNVELVSAIKPNPGGIGLANRNFISMMAERDQQEHFKILTKHRVIDSTGQLRNEVKFDLMTHESIGAQKFFGLIGPMVQALKNSHVLVVDELDGHLSSFLISLLLKLFNSMMHNQNGAQLIFSTHNTDVLEPNFGYLRRDQISIFEKKKTGVTSIKTLHKYGVRNDASFRKLYLEGRFFEEEPPGTQMSLFDNW